MDFRYYDVPDDRELRILDAVVRIYTETARPVSSTAVCRDLAQCWSSATVRNVFADLEGYGWLAQPHPSAGRVPTDLGYRVFVERVVRPAAKPDPIPAWLESNLDLGNAPLGETLEQASRLISRISHALGLTLVILAPGPEAVGRGIQVTGVEELLHQPELEDPTQLRGLVHVLDEDASVGDYLNSLVDESGDLRLMIGSENSLDYLSGFSLAATRIDRDEETALVGVLGPVRMEYPMILSAMQSLVRLLATSGSDPKSWS